MSTFDRATYDEETYDELYRSAPRLWSGRPNPQLVAEVADLPAGAALDVGCGEGGDALWLAERGWQVTAVDFSTVALERATARARERGVDDRIDWVHADVRAEPPPEGRFDLVSAQFLQLPSADRRPLFQRLAAAVAPGGTLLVVGHDVSHDVSHLGTAAHRVHAADRFFTADEVAASLPPGEWEVLVADARPRPANEHEGAVRDAVLRAARRPGSAAR